MVREGNSSEIKWTDVHEKKGTANRNVIRLRIRAAKAKCIDMSIALALGIALGVIVIFARPVGFPRSLVQILQDCTV